MDIFLSFLSIISLFGGVSVAVIFTTKVMWKIKGRYHVFQKYPVLFIVIMTILLFLCNSFNIFIIMLIAGVEIDFTIILDIFKFSFLVIIGYFSSAIIIRDDENRGE